MLACMLAGLSGVCLLIRSPPRSILPTLLLREAWTAAAPGRLAPQEQCKLWALRQVLRKQGEDDDQYEWMASQVIVVGGGHPERGSVRDFFLRVDAAGEHWYPGFTTGKRGRPVEMTKKKRQAIATSMMAAKSRGELPCYETAVAYCPRASFNETTQEIFSRQTINEVLTTDCYDETPDRPWEFRFGAQRRPLTTEAKEQRVEWGARIQQEGRTAAWFRDNVIWMDICSKVIPGNPAVALDQARTAQNKRKRLMSPGSREKSVNVGGSVTADKQCGYGSVRVYFGVVLTRGVLGVVVFTDINEFPGETPAGAKLLVERLPDTLRGMLGHSARKPLLLFTDRGPGFYHRRWGTITGDYESACRELGFKPWAGSNSKRGPHAQPPDLADVLLHETAVSWLRRQEEQTRPTRPWEEMPQQLAERLRQGASRINKEFDVRGLCMELPGRLSLLVCDTCGDRLAK